MPIKPVQKITAWSYSRWSTYQQCPFKAKLKFIDKKKEPGSKAMDRGSDIHSLAEGYVKGTVKALPKELALFKSEFQKLRKLKAEAELSITFRADWTPTTWDDWDGAWVRIKIDALTPPNKFKSITIIDHKTGKPRDGYMEQLELYALAGFLTYPQAEEARANLWYLDHGTIVGADADHNPHGEGVYERKELPKLIKIWERRVTPMLNDTRFAPRPGPYCVWCHFSKNKAGPCKF